MRDGTINTIMMAAFIALVACVLFLMNGCATPQAGNPADIEVEIEDSDSNIVVSVMHISPSMGDFMQSDMFKDLLKELIPELDLPAIPSTPGGQIKPQPKPEPTPTPDPEPGNGGDADGDQTLLWKSKYDTVSGKPAESGSGVLLLPAALPDPSSAALSVGGTLIPASRITRNGHNGNRAHIRFEDAYPRGAGVIDVLWPDGSSESYPIADTHARQ